MYHVEALEAVGEEPKLKVRIVSPRRGLEPWRRVQALVNQMAFCLFCSIPLSYYYYSRLLSLLIVSNCFPYFGILRSQY